MQHGSIALRGKRDRVWVGRWREDEVLPDGTIHRKRRAEVLGTLKDYPTKRLALRALESKVAEVNSPSYRATPTIPFSEFAARWQASVLVNHEPSTQSSTNSVLRSALVPAFGALPLKDITTERLQRFVSGSKLQPKTIKNQIATLRMLWTNARAWGYVSQDPFGGLVLPKDGYKEQGCFSIDEMRKIIEAAREPYKVLFWLAAETGVRVGELTALRWEDIDAATRRVQVRRSVWRGYLRQRSPASREPASCRAV